MNSQLQRVNAVSNNKTALQVEIFLLHAQNINSHLSYRLSNKRIALSLRFQKRNVFLPRLRKHKLLTDLRLISFPQHCQWREKKKIYKLLQDAFYLLTAYSLLHLFPFAAKLQKFPLRGIHRPHIRPRQTAKRLPASSTLSIATFLSSGLYIASYMHNIHSNFRFSPPAQLPI